MVKRSRMYCYSGCGTCRKALKWLGEHGVEVDVLPIREQPPTVVELKRAVKQVPSIRALFNTSGADYKSMNLRERLPNIGVDEALELLTTNGNLVKRPFLVRPDGSILVGFSELSYADAFR